MNATKQKVVTAVDVGNAMITAKHEIMTDEQSELFIMSFMYDRFPVNEELSDEIVNSFPWQVLDKRLKVAGVIDVTEGLRMFIVIGLCESPGEIVMWAALLATMQAKGIARNMSGLTQIFENGYPTKDEMRLIWEMQKRKGQPDNWLDMREAW